MFDLSKPHLKQQLLSSFLNLLSSQFNPCLSSKSNYYGDAFLHGELASEYAASLFFKLDNSNETAIKSDIFFNFPLKVWPMTLPTVMQRKGWFYVFGLEERQAIDEGGQGRKEFIQ
jgi:hypothetical protein